MPQYKAPINDIRFLLDEVLDYPAHYADLPNGEDADPDTVSAILEECARFCEDELAPLYASGDAEGCRFDNGEVHTPKGYREAYAKFVEAGWHGLSHPVEYGGQGLPMSLGLAKSEMMATANWPFFMYPGLSMGAMNTIMRYGSEEQKALYMPPLTEGRWTGTMCLTEAQCGTDLGQMKTRASDNGDGTYALHGTKIFISSGEHDLAENIVHIVLGRLPDAPEGTRGISLFIVPKFIPDASGQPGERNAVHCTGIEHKMGIHASSTCTMQFDGATAWLIGEAHKGLEAMFIFMNSARVGTAMQGLAHAELSLQGAVAYARERRSMRALSGKKDPDQVADAIIHHADVRRMLLTQKAIAEGGRAMIYYAGKFADHLVNAVVAGDDEAFETYDDKLGFFTPILKGFLTEMGLEAANHGMQVFGGHGYIKEHGMEQIARDARISTLYEGTTGIQALDLLGRKVLLLTKGGAVRGFTADMARFAAGNLRRRGMRRYCAELARLATQWNWLTVRLMLMASRDRDVVSSASHHFLMYSGYVAMAWFWAMQAGVALQKLADGSGAQSEAFYRAKVATADFYFDHLLPRARGHAESMTRPSRSMMTMPAEDFLLD